MAISNSTGREAQCNGAAFTASQYPKLALAYPALKLPDLRAEFIRAGVLCD
jgi:hypothetical protein